MTLKYESEILFNLMKRDGDDTPSDVLPYESELKEKYLNQVVGAYPKLMDYRPEWLNYNLNAHLPSNFPVETLSNVTEATVDNVVPYAYGSAILSGQTLVNMVTFKQTNTNASFDNATNVITLADSTGWIRFDETRLKPSTKYIIIIDILECTLGTDSRHLKISLGDGTLNVINVSSEQFKVGRIVVTGTTPSTILTNYFNAQTRMGSSCKFKLMVIEYREGMENWDIPYFEGIQSVKLPVLTTSNEDGTKTNILTVNEDVTLRGIGEVRDTLDCLTGEVRERIGEIVLDGSENWSVGMIGGNYSRFYCKNSFMINETSINKHLTNNFVSLNAHSVETEGTWLQQAENGCLFSIKLNNSKLISLDIHGLKQYLSENNLKVQYISKQEFIKTANLTITDQDGNTESIIRPIEGTMHVSTSSQTLPPLLDMSVPVEATSQNLMSFANIVEEEK